MKLNDLVLLREHIGWKLVEIHPEEIPMNTGILSSEINKYQYGYDSIYLFKIINKVKIEKYGYESAPRIIFHFEPSDNDMKYLWERDTNTYYRIESSW
jgi:hypothetical protein